MIAQFTMELQWKEFNLNLDLVKTGIAAVAGAQFCGLSADSSLKVHFIEEPTQQEKDAVTAYYDGLTDVSTEAADYVTQAQIAAAITAARAAIPGTLWGDLTVAQQKLLAGLTPTNAELGL